MKIAKVVGVAICTVKEPRLENSKLLIVSNTDQTGKIIGDPYIAQDVVGVGPDELVIVVEGSSARVAAWDVNAPVDAVIVGILNSIQFDGQTTFKKH
ncbi:MAG TPA: EutN/CcmL family microcompartment protein [Patescibacteria group bacterium]|jgi:microcompartment protein CcmK/EutM|nr:EutN/CcmL family microcompartment protein [Patescibacteria group bacterium]